MIHLARLILLSSLLLANACANILNRGTPCGGERNVDARAVLPDTGLGAGGDANISFNESDPNRSLDESSLIVWTFPPANTMFADNPPRVRVITDDGRVFLDLTATSAYLGSWYVRAPVAKGAIRDEIVAAFQNGLVTVEFSTSGPAPKVTRVRPTVRFAGTTPVVLCV
jgi:hypothetical protein